MSIVTINISLPAALKRKVEAAIAEDGYGNTSEFFRELARDYLRSREERRLGTLLLEGLESGEPTPLTKDDLDEIRRAGIKRIREKSS